MKTALGIGSAALTTLVISVVAAQAPSGRPAGSRLGASAFLESPGKSAAGAAGEKPAEKLREGTKLNDELGAFSRVGERVSFSPGGNREALRCLENLALERIARAIDESQGQRQWIVSGTITEFKGANYLLVTKAVIKLQEGETANGP